MQGRTFWSFMLRGVGRGIKTPEDTGWMVYIPDEGHWPIAHKPRATYEEAREAYLKWAERKQLPRGSFLELFEEQAKYPLREPKNKV